MKRRTWTLWISAAAGVAAMLGSVPGTDAAPKSRTPLYDQYCSGCHGSASKFGARTPSQIQSAINSVSDMSGLRSLSQSTIQAISNELSRAHHGRV